MADALYFVESDFGKLGRAFIELDRDTNSKRGVIADIVSGEIEHVIRILEVCEDEGTCRDVTEDIARDVAAALEYPPEGQLKDFLENAIGCRFVADLERDMEGGRSDYAEHNTHHYALSGAR